MESNSRWNLPPSAKEQRSQPAFRVEGKTEFDLAKRFFEVAEEVGSLIDQLKYSHAKEKKFLTTSEIAHISTQARRIILGKACEILKLSDRARRYAILERPPEDSN